LYIYNYYGLKDGFGRRNNSAERKKILRKRVVS